MSDKLADIMEDLMTGHNWDYADKAIRELLIEAQTDGVAWAIKQIDLLHIGSNYTGTTDKLFKGMKNNIRDLYQGATGVDPAPKYPVNVRLRK
jgi:hypothetical protein